jgi:hypothetical protein
MNKSASVLLLLICVVLSGCKEGLNFSLKGKYMTPGSLNSLNGNIICLTEKNFVIVSTNNKDSADFNDTDSICFDQNGNMKYEMIHIKDYMVTESIFDIHKNGVDMSSKTYDKDSLIGTLTTVSKKIKPGQFESITYKNGEASRKRIYTYDKDSYIIGIKDFVISNKKEIFKLHQKQVNDNDGRVISANFYDSSGKPIAQYIYCYSKYYGPDTIITIENNNTSVQVYKYDQYGNPLLQMIGPDTVKQYNYEYDEYGNWVKRINYEYRRKATYQTRKYYYK